MSPVSTDFRGVCIASSSDSTHASKDTRCVSASFRRARKRRKTRSRRGSAKFSVSGSSRSAARSFDVDLELYEPDLDVVAVDCAVLTDGSVMLEGIRGIDDGRIATL